MGGRVWELWVFGKAAVPGMAALQREGGVRTERSPAHEPRYIRVAEQPGSRQAGRPRKQGGRIERSLVESIAQLPCQARLCRVVSSNAVHADGQLGCQLAPDLLDQSLLVMVPQHLCQTCRV